MHGSEPFCNYDGKTVDYCACEEYEQVRADERTYTLDEAITVVESFMSESHSGSDDGVDFILLDIVKKLQELYNETDHGTHGVHTCNMRDSSLCGCDPKCAWDQNLLARCSCPEGEGHRK